MENDQKRIIEINGVKLEVDMRYAKRVEELRVGSKVKVLKKGYSDYVVYPGIIVGFEEFKKLPTIIVAYLEADYSKSDIKFVHYNEQSKDIEIVSALSDEFDLNREDAISQFDREIAKAERVLSDIKEKKAYFEKQFGVYWSMALAPKTEDVF